MRASPQTVLPIWLRRGELRLFDKGQSGSTTTATEAEKGLAARARSARFHSAFGLR